MGNAIMKQGRISKAVRAALAELFGTKEDLTHPGATIPGEIDRRPSDAEVRRRLETQPRPQRSLFRVVLAALFKGKSNGFIDSAQAGAVRYLRAVQNESDAPILETEVEAPEGAAPSEEREPQKNKQTPQERAAAKILGDAPAFLYTLDNFGENFKRMPHDVFAVRYAAAALCDQIRKHYATAAGKLPAKHPSRKHLNMAAGALDSLQEFMAMVDLSEEGEASKPSEAFRVMVGEVIRFYVALSGRHMERGEQAMNERPTCGYLQGAGMEDDDLRQVSDAEIALLHDFRRLNERRQGAAVRFLASLASRQE